MHVRRPGSVTIRRRRPVPRSRTSRIDSRELSEVLDQLSQQFDRPVDAFMDRTVLEQVRRHIAVGASEQVPVLGHARELVHELLKNRGGAVERAIGVRQEPPPRLPLPFPSGGGGGPSRRLSLGGPLPPPRGPQRWARRPSARRPSVRPVVRPSGPCWLAGHAGPTRTAPAGQFVTVLGPAR